MLTLTFLATVCFVVFVIFQRARGKGKAGESSSKGSGRASSFSLASLLVPDNIHPTLQFTKQKCGWKYAVYNENLLTLKEKDIVHPRLIDWHPLEEAGLARSLRITLTQSIISRWDGDTYSIDDWERLFAIQEPIYAELCLEFFSTVEMFQIKSVNDALLGFRLGGQDRVMSLMDMAVCLNIYDDEVLNAPYFDDYIFGGAWLDEFETPLDVMWQNLSDAPYTTGSNFSSNLRAMEHRLIQKFLAHSIACRGKNTEKVNAQDMWYLNKIKSRQRVSIPYCVAESLMAHGKGHKDSSKIAGGHYVTLIAKHLDVRLGAKKNPYTLVEHHSPPLSIEMFSAARAVSQERKKFIPWRPSKKSQRESTSSHPPQQQGISEPRVDQHMEDVQHGDGVSQYQNAPSWFQGFITNFDNLQLQQQNFQEESRYEWGVQRYFNDWQRHNTQRIYSDEDDVSPTPYQQFPRWGEPGAVNPVPAYDRQAALDALERHQRGEQQEYSQQEGTGHWLFGD